MSEVPSSRSRPSGYRFPDGLVECRFRYRVRYAETDQMGTFYNARALEWFEVGRSELSRAMGLPYTEWEKRGAFLPLVESYVRYLGPASYDEELEMRVGVEATGRAKLRFHNEVHKVTNGAPVCRGYTLHMVVDESLRPCRLPDWARAMVEPVR
ncbi:MAG: acyl-CoA thioesterase [Verrucomicrobia bacterium]|nr:acyl-CoA thioesterase [Verrucomicrobiota bacterium]